MGPLTERNITPRKDDKKMPKSRIYKPGEIVLRSGRYEIIGPKGGRTDAERTVVKDEPLPPPYSGARSRLQAC